MLDHCLILAVQPDRWNVDVCSKMVDDGGRSSVSQMMPSLLQGGEIAERMLTTLVGRNTAYAKYTNCDAVFRP